MLGALISLLSAFSFSMSDIMVRRGVARASASQGAFVTVLVGVPLFLIATIVTGQILRLGDIDAAGYGLLAGAGVVHYVIGRFANYAAIRAIGAARASPLQSLTLPYSVLTALILLGEGVTLGMGIGILLILLGPAIMVERQLERMPAPAAELDPVATTVEQESFRLRQVEGYIAAAIAAVAYGSSPVLIRAAIEGESGLSLLGGLISYVAAAALLLASLALPGRRHMVSALHPDVVRAFFAAGFFVFLAQVLRFVALALAPVAVVAALLRFASIFTLVLSWVMNRRLEHITGRLVAGVLVSIAGALLLVVSRA